MLKVPATFPHPGAAAFVAPHGEAVRIIQANADGSHLIARKRHPSILGNASDTFRAEPGTLFATEAEAIGKKPARKRRAA
jgi:hypothetical protein